MAAKDVVFGGDARAPDVEAAARRELVGVGRAVGRALEHEAGRIRIDRHALGEVGTGPGDEIGELRAAAPQPIFDLPV